MINVIKHIFVDCVFKMKLSSSIKCMYNMYTYSIWGKKIIIDILSSEMSQICVEDRKHRHEDTQD